MMTTAEVWSNVESYLAGYRKVMVQCVAEGVYPAVRELERTLDWYFRLRDFGPDTLKYRHAGATDAMLDAVQARLDPVGWMRRAPTSEQLRMAEPWTLNGPVGHDGN